MGVNCRWEEESRPRRALICRTHWGGAWECATANQVTQIAHDICIACAMTDAATALEISTKYTIDTRMSTHLFKLNMTRRNP